MITPNDFVWSEEDGIYECPPDKSGADFTVSIDFIEEKISDSQVEAAKKKAAENFPNIITKGEVFLKSSYKWLLEDDSENRIPDEDEFLQSFKLEEMCLVDGEYASIYYSGLKSFDNYYLTVFLNDELKFEYAEIEEMEEE